MICAHLLAHIFIKFEQCNKKTIKKWVGHDLCTSYWFFDTKWENDITFSEIKKNKKKRRKNREYIKKERKSREQKRGKENKKNKKIKRGKKKLFK